MIYLDHAAATPVDDEVLAAMRPYWQRQFYNPSSLYAAGREVKTALEEARRSVAGSLSVRAGEIYFTAGATESINMAFRGVAARFPGSSVAVSGIEHESVLKAATVFSGTDEIVVNGSGLVKPEAVRQAITSDTVLVSVGYINSEIGTIQPMSEIGEAIKQERARRRQDENNLPLYFHTDASAAPDYAAMDMRRLGVDMASVNGGKIYGPKQSGLLFVSRDVELEPYIRGGGQESGLRGGTENVPFAIGLAKALEISAGLRRPESKRQSGLRDRLIKALLQIPDCRLNGPGIDRSPGNVNVGFASIDGEDLVHHLDAAGIMAATGAACSANNDKPSHVLKAIGVPEDYVRGSARFSLGRSTAASDIREVIEAVSALVTKLRGRR